MLKTTIELKEDCKIHATNLAEKRVKEKGYEGYFAEAFIEGFVFGYALGLVEGQIRLFLNGIISLTEISETLGCDVDDILLMSLRYRDGVDVDKMIEIIYV